MVAERRTELLEMAREFDLVIVEDNPYGMLRFEGEPIPSLAALEQEEGDLDRVVYLGTFSKIFAPGVRLGWVHAQPGILHKINVGKQGADLCSSNLSQMMISSYFQNADWRAYVKRLTTMYKERRDAMLDSLAEFMPKEVHWTHPEGGLFVWATLPSYLDATAMLPRAIARNVAYVPGEGFYGGSPGTGKNNMRLNFSFVEPERIRRGIELLSEVVRERMELRSDLERGSHLSVRSAVGTDGLGSWRAWRSCAAGTRWSATSRLSRAGACSTPSNASATRSIPSTSRIRRRERSWGSRPTQPSSACTAPAARMAPYRRF